MAIRPVLKIFALPFMLVAGVLYSVIKFFVIASGTVLGILSELVFLIAPGILFSVGLWSGTSWMAADFLISPYGLPMLAAWLTARQRGLCDHLSPEAVFFPVRSRRKRSIDWTGACAEIYERRSRLCCLYARRQTPYHSHIIFNSTTLD